MHESQINWHMLGYEIDQEDGRKITIEAMQKRKNTNNTISLLMHATMKTKSRPETKDGIVKLPREEIKILHDTLHYYARLISIAEIEKVSLSSPIPGDGFIPENEDEKKFLDSTKGIEIKIGTDMWIKPSYFKEIINDQLLDRQDGVKIMSNINSINDSLSKFKELVRLFENAFRPRNQNQLVRQLYDFLNSNENAEYERHEIESWITEDRNAAIHGDLTRTPFLIHEEDINPDIKRILQAGYDVLFNKEKWHDCSTTRRTNATPLSVINRTGTTVYQNVIKNSGVTITHEDRPFYAAEKKEDELTRKTFVPPKNWWSKIFQKNS